MHYNTLQHSFVLHIKQIRPKYIQNLFIFGFEYRSGNGGGKFDDDDFDKVCVTRDEFMCDMTHSCVT